MNLRVKELRKYLNMTQGAFGSRLGTTGNSISDLETGKTNASDTIVKLMCKEFGVSEEWLRNGEGEMFVKLDREEEILKWIGETMKPENDESFQNEFLHILSRLDADDWKALEKMAKMFLEEKNS